jgi:hypothetical protein
MERTHRVIHVHDNVLYILINKIEIRYSVSEFVISAQKPVNL